MWIVPVDFIPATAHSRRRSCVVDEERMTVRWHALFSSLPKFIALASDYLVKQD
jgi:hypothetical protein